MRGESPIKQRVLTTIEGIVQGVGFRPFVYGLARRHGLAGYVANTSTGVEVEVEGAPEAVAEFLARLKTDVPPLARIVRLETACLPPASLEGFRIEESRMAGAGRSALISPDVAVCADCLREMFDPADRRYRYPFINCTNCGPRYTIVTGVPYDRPRTTMARFEMCPKCAREYHDPADRRFHAQPIACPACGPKIWLEAAQGDAQNGSVSAAVSGASPSDTSSDPIGQVCRLLEQGAVVAIKGLGGFHLAVDASQEAAVARLRRRKGREEKPLALMSGDLEAVRRYARAGWAEESLLLSRERPIVLLEKDDPQQCLIAPSVAPRNRLLGVMLPYTPLHYLIMRQVQTPALVMTSANLSEEPLCADNDEARRRLAGIADWFLFHDRDIHLRADDSVLSLAAGSARLIRRARGFVPVPVFLRDDISPVLAVGAEMKNTICLAKGRRAFLSQHIGDLEKNQETQEFFERTVDHLKRILDIEPEVLAHDLHPEYLSTKWVLAQAGVRLVGVQHHFAHIVSCLAENQVFSGPVVGLALDGTGWGTDGHIWGGELLIADLVGFRRAGHFGYVALPGGAKAIREPWRMAFSYLRAAFFGEDFPELPFLKGVDAEARRLLPRMIDRGVNSPLTSSCGRLFDAVAALCGLRSRVAYEGQAALELEQAMAPAGGGRPFPFSLSRDEAGCIIIDFLPTVRQIALEVARSTPVGEISLRFHLTVIEALAEAASELRRETGIGEAALSGGCFQNRFLLARLSGRLAEKGFTKIYTQTQVPSNDGGISLGQAVAAAC
ncbi:MAG: carbamoyltransferase HypF [Pseudomonadota bacterium]